MATHQSDPQPTPWAAILLATELAAPVLAEPPRAKPIAITVDPPRGRTFSTLRRWTAPQRVGHGVGERGKGPSENAQQGRLERDPTPILDRLSDDLPAASRERALMRLTALEMVDTIGGELDAALHGGNARLANVALARALREAGAKWPRFSELLEHEIKTARSSRFWFVDTAEAEAFAWLGEYRAPPPPPLRDPPSARYLEVCRLVLEEMALAGCAPAMLDPLAPHEPPRVEVSARSTPDHDTGKALARIGAGYQLAFEPACGRAVPPALNTPGASWRALASGAGWVLQVG